MERILERDRQTSGRSAADTPAEDRSGAQRNPSLPPPPSETALSDTKRVEDNIIRNITANITAQEERRQDAQKRRKKGSQEDTQQEDPIRDPHSLHAYARDLAATTPIPITLRLPEGLNDWLDDYAHNHRKQGVKKQDLVARAVELLVLSLGAPYQDLESRG
jgi:hypothetical protein